MPASSALLIIDHVLPDRPEQSHLKPGHIVDLENASEPGSIHRNAGGSVATDVHS
jgi:hypothetical protein